MSVKKCDCCGSPVRIEGHTTQYYVPLYKNQIPEFTDEAIHKLINIPSFFSFVNEILMMGASRSKLEEKLISVHIDAFSQGFRKALELVNKKLEG